MKSLARLGGGPAVTIPAAMPALPSLPGNLAYALSVALRPVTGGTADNPGLLLRPPTLTPDEASRAAEAVLAMDNLLAHPVTLALMAAWLLPVNLASRNPQAPDEFGARVSAITELCGDLPAAGFTAEARRRIASDGFFPSAHDIRRAVEPAVLEWRRARDALRRLAQPRSEPPRRGSPAQRAESPDERAAAAARNRAMIEAMKARLEAEAASGVAKTRPAHLPPAVLVGAYRKAGLHGRADALAAALGVPEAAPADAGESRPPSMPLG